MKLRTLDLPLAHRLPEAVADASYEPMQEAYTTKESLPLHKYHTRTREDYGCASFCICLCTNALRYKWVHVSNVCICVCKCYLCTCPLMCSCMCVHMCKHDHTCTCVYCACALNECIHISTHMCLCKCAMCMHMYVCACVYVYKRVCVRLLCDSLCPDPEPYTNHYTIVHPILNLEHPSH